MQTIGDRVRQTREARVMTQTELADAAGVHRVHVNRIERGRRQPRPGTIRALAAALRVDPAILGGVMLPGAGDIAGPVANATNNGARGD